MGYADFLPTLWRYPSNKNVLSKSPLSMKICFLFSISSFLALQEVWARFDNLLIKSTVCLDQ